MLPLPREILDVVVDGLDSSSLARFAQCNRTYHSWYLPRVYHTVEVGDFADPQSCATISWQHLADFVKAQHSHSSASKHIKVLKANTEVPYTENRVDGYRQERNVVITLSPPDLDLLRDTARLWADSDEDAERWVSTLRRGNWFEDAWIAMFLTTTTEIEVLDLRLNMNVEEPECGVQGLTASSSWTWRMLIYSPHYCSNKTAGVLRQSRHSCLKDLTLRRFCSFSGDRKPSIGGPSEPYDLFPSNPSVGPYLPVMNLSRLVLINCVFNDSLEDLTALLRSLHPLRTFKCITDSTPQRSGTIRPTDTLLSALTKRHSDSLEELSVTELNWFSRWRIVPSFAGLKKLRRLHIDGCVLQLAGGEAKGTHDFLPATLEEVRLLSTSGVRILNYKTLMRVMKESGVKRFMIDVKEAFSGAYLTYRPLLETAKSLRVETVLWNVTDLKVPTEGEDPKVRQANEVRRVEWNDACFVGAWPEEVERWNRKELYEM
ncbi:hypothetical protein B9Z65_286 [Elsinoe australis]|uniref:F-box domain-containing protein n=1 Tax=Elsinoe australis TaxID=40998 RepID=A0A2P7ZQ56_9PEZI|nr:hypothetical protein B9Z65_286 [Elsinoe australis]